MAKEPETLGERMALARKRLGFSQEALCEAAGVPLGSIKKWEGGNTAPGGANLAKLAKVGIDLNWLVTGTSYMTDSAGKQFFYVPPDPLDDQVRAIREMNDAAYRAAMAAAEVPKPAASTTPPQINAKALAAALEAMRKLAKPGEAPEVTADKAARFYQYCLDQGLITPEGLGEGHLKKAG